MKAINPRDTGVLVSCELGLGKVVSVKIDKVSIALLGKSVTLSVPINKVKKL